MAVSRVEEYIRHAFENTGVKIEVIQGQQTFEQDYPCFAAVNRCASAIPRHDGRIIWLTYEPEGPVEKTLMLVGKGVTYDTGGLDIKAGGNARISSIDVTHYRILTFISIPRHHGRHVSGQMWSRRRGRHSQSRVHSQA